MNRVSVIGIVNHTIATRLPIDMHTYGLASNPDINSLCVGNQDFNLLYAERNPKMRNHKGLLFFKPFKSFTTIVSIH